MDNSYLASLVEAVAAHRDRKAFGELHKRFARKMRLFLVRSGVEPGMAEELTQDVMFKLWDCAHQYDRRRATVGTWLFGIVQNARADHFRKRRGDPPIPPIGDDALSLPDNIEPADEALINAQWHERVRAAHLKLPPKQLEIITLAFFEGLSHTQISVRTGLPRGTVKGRIRAALRRLRRIMDASVPAEASVPPAKNGSCLATEKGPAHAALPTRVRKRAPASRRRREARTIA